MAILRDTLDRTIGSIKQIKADRVGTPAHELAPVLLAIRGREQIAQIHPCDGGAEYLLHCAALAIRGFCPDVLACAFEAWASPLPINPRTGQPWAGGELAEAAEAGGVAKGWVADALTIGVFNRAGDQLSVSLGYRLDEQRRLHWRAPEHLGGPDQSAVAAGELGVMHAVITRLMQEEDALQTLAAHQLGTARTWGMDQETMMAHIDIATAKTFIGQIPLAEAAPRAVVALRADPGSRREELIRAAFPSGVRIDPGEGGHQSGPQQSGPGH